jgi:putative hydrolase of the HAD superfamily
VPLLTELRARGHRLALLSDGLAEVQRRKLAALGLAGLFDEIVITDELGRDAWKPSKVGFERILGALDVEGQFAMYVSDNPHKDFAGPHRLGMRTVRIVRSCTEHGEALAPAPEHQPQRMICALHELLATPVR